MKTLTVRLPEKLVAQLDAESKSRKLSKSDIIRERLEAGRTPRGRVAALDAISDLIGAVRGLPPDLTRRKKHHLKATGYGKKHSR